MSIPEDVIENVRDAADIVAIIGEEVQLKRTGSDYRGPCPFHGGTHRNFAVIPKKQLFYCFVCHEGGDVFTYQMKRHGMDYPTAVREIARRVGITIPERSTGGPDPREHLFSAVAAASDWYAHALRDSEEAASARSYLESRDFAVADYPDLGLGFAPGGEAFLESMERIGYARDTLLEAGLAVKRDDGSLRPRFWKRIVFPIHDVRGRVVGFGGRALGDQEPKYLNSPESAIFHKGSLLYNLHHAKNAIRKHERAILVEGYFDALRLVQVGIDEVVAPLGTSLTEDQARLLKRYTKQVSILYDSDSAGLRATFRAGDVMLRTGLRVSVATLPEGEDPDTLAHSGGSREINRYIRDAVDILERKIQLLDRKGWLGDVAGRRRSLDRLLPTLRAAGDPVTRDLYVGRVAEALQIAPESVQREVGSLGDRRSGERSRRPTARAGPARVDERERFGRPERILVKVMLHDPDWRARIREQISDASVLLQPDRELFELLAEAEGDLASGELVSYVEGEARTLLTELLEEPLGKIDLDAEVTGALNKLESRRLKVEQDELWRRLPLADDGEKAELSKKISELNRRISQLDPGYWPLARRGRSSAV